MLGDDDNEEDGVVVDTVDLAVDVEGAPSDLDDVAALDASDADPVAFVVARRARVVRRGGVLTSDSAAGSSCAPAEPAILVLGLSPRPLRGVLRRGGICDEAQIGKQQQSGRSTCLRC